MSFSEEVRSLFGQYDQNIRVIRDESTLEIFSHILKSPSKQIRPVYLRSVKIGKFYVIKYNFNGNKLWCPILTVPPLINKNENVNLLLKIIKINMIKMRIKFQKVIMLIQN